MADSGDEIEAAVAATDILDYTLDDVTVSFIIQWSVINCNSVERSSFFFQIQCQHIFVKMRGSFFQNQDNFVNPSSPFYRRSVLFIV